MAQSWYGDPEQIATSFSASHACNNLSKLGNNLVYVSEDDVVYADTGEVPYVTHKLPIADKTFVHQTRLCRVHGTTVIVIASDRGIEVFDEKGQNRVFELLLKDHVEAEEGGALFCRGICAVNSEHQSALVVGTSVGKRLVVGADKDAKEASVHDLALVSTLPEHKEAIQAMDCTHKGAFVASSDDSGTILVCDADSSFAIVRRIPGSTFPAVTLRFTPSGWLVAGYLTGMLRIFHKDTFLLFAEVTAHTRAITALDTNDDYIVSVSEDTFMNVWEFDDHKASPRIKLVSAQCVANDVLVGVAFTGTQTLLTSSYDTAHLKLWMPT